MVKWLIRLYLLQLKIRTRKIVTKLEIFDEKSKIDVTKIYFYLENQLQINTWFYYFLTNNYFIVKGYPQCANCLAWGAHLEHALGAQKKHLRKLVKKKSELENDCMSPWVGVQSINSIEVWIRLRKRTKVLRKKWPHRHKTCLKMIRELRRPRQLVQDKGKLVEVV